MTAFLMFSSILWVIDQALTNSFSYITLIQSSSIKVISVCNYLLKNNYIQMKKKKVGIIQYMNTWMLLYLCNKNQQQKKTDKQLEHETYFFSLFWKQILLLTWSKQPGDTRKKFLKWLCSIRFMLWMMLYFLKLRVSMTFERLNKTQVKI